MSELYINKNLPHNATELTNDDLCGLIPNYISTRNELNQFEKENITQALIWLRKTKRNYQDILKIDFCCDLHTRMFNKTWSWAGKFRTREINIGNIAPEQVAVKVKNTLDDTSYWIEHQVYPIDEICLRLHRNLVWIHPFTNGNGRHTRIMSDTLRIALGLSSFTWGGDLQLVTTNKSRLDYIHALKCADNGNYELLLRFALSKK